MQSNSPTSTNTPTCQCLFFFYWLSFYESYRPTCKSSGAEWIYSLEIWKPFKLSGLDFYLQTVKSVWNVLESNLTGCNHPWHFSTGNFFYESCTYKSSEAEWINSSEYENPSSSVGYITFLYERSEQGQDERPAILFSNVLESNLTGCNHQWHP